MDDGCLSVNGVTQTMTLFAEVTYKSSHVVVSDVSDERHPYVHTMFS